MVSGFTRPLVGLLRQLGQLDDRSERLRLVLGGLGSDELLRSDLERVHLNLVCLGSRLRLRGASNSVLEGHDYSETPAELRKTHSIWIVMSSTVAAASIPLTLSSS